MTPEQRREVLEYRHFMNYPLHAPPHFSRESNLYLLSAAHYEHCHIMQEEDRRNAFERELLELLYGIPDTEIFAWSILPNHYHVLAKVYLELFAEKIGKLHNGISTRWNKEDHLIGCRKVWHKFTDRGIRDEAHFWATVNYIHLNAVIHGYIEIGDQWRNTSYHLYLEKYSRNEIELLEKAYPPLDYGKGWDW